MIDVKILGVHGIDTAKLAKSTCVGSTNIDVSLISLIGSTYNSFHRSVLEHIIVQYEVTASIGIISQLNRHKHIAISQQSTRYALKKMLKNGDKDLDNCLSIIKQLQDEGLNNDEVKHLIPQGLTTRVIYTQTLPDLTNVIVRRLDSHAHIEARKVASMLYTRIQEYPHIEYNALHLLISRIIKNIYHYVLVKEYNLWRLEEI